VPEITVDVETYDLLRVAANAAGVSISEVVRRGVAALRGDPPPPDPDPWEEVPVYATYRGLRFDGLFVAATARLVVTTGELAGQAFSSPSAAAGAVVALVNPGRDARTNGWRLWRLAATGDYLDVLRSRRLPRTDRRPDDFSTMAPSSGSTGPEETTNPGA
jgi:hypothetical protein